ncbi:MAG: helix-turn-helix transcriptional regulator [Ignavibacteriae bacterium]|nr:helix-turn-helix transcriptional regulator [Ignavibacteriota bacterium]
MLEFKNIITYIFAIGAAQAVFLFFILWKKKENNFANKFLAITMIVFAVDLSGGVLFLSGYIKYFPWFLGLNNSLPYLYGPLIYLYIIFLIHKQEKIETNNFLHFIPFLIVQVYGIFFFYFEGSEYQLSLIDFSKEPPWHIVLVGTLIPFVGLLYLILTVIITLKYNRVIKNKFSNIEKIDLNWLLFLVYGTVIIWLIVFLSYLLDVIYGQGFQANLLIYISISIFLYTLAIKSYKQPEIETINYETETYKKSGLTEDKADEYLKNLLEIMKDDKPHLDTKLSLNNLADKVGISSHNLSEIINTKLEQNFYDFINSYRVEEVKKLITEDKEGKYNLLAHGFEAGFSSKSAYYSAFKKFTGKTPAQFRNNL